MGITHLLPPLSLGKLVRDVRRDFGRCFAAVIAFEVAFKFFAVFLLIPALAAVLFYLMHLSGRTAVTNTDILGFLLSPAGVAYTLLLGVEALGILLLEHAVVIGLVAIKQTGNWVGLRYAIFLLAIRAAAVFRLAALFLLAAVLVVAPFAALAALTYWMLLSGHDINYYLAVQPPRFFVAVTIGVVLALVAAFLLAGLYARWSFALPIVLVENQKPLQAMFASAQRTRGVRTRIAMVLIGWLVIGITAEVLAIGGFKMLASFVLSERFFDADTDAEHLVPVVVAVLVAKTVVVAGLSILVVLINSMLILRLYVHRSARLGVLDSDSWGTTLRASVSPSRMVRRLEWAGLAVALILGAIYLAGTLSFQLNDSVMNTAHRGYSAAAPENTRAAVLKSAEVGADWAEIDVQLTRDGKVLLLHDRDLARMIGISERPGALDLAVIQSRPLRLEAAFRERYQSERLPTLDQVIKDLWEYDANTETWSPRIKLNIELKFFDNPREPLVREVIKVIEETGFEEHCFLASMDYRGMRLAKQARPDWPVALIVAEAMGDILDLDVDILSVHQKLATPEFIRRAKGAGKKVHAWTINDRRDMRRMVERGVDGIITDEPGMLAEVLKERAGLSDVERMLLACRYLLD